MTVKTRITLFIVGAGFVASLLFSVVVFHELIEQFFKLVLMSGLNLESLYKLYVGKNILNQFQCLHD